MIVLAGFVGEILVFFTGAPAEESGGLGSRDHSNTAKSCEREMWQVLEHKHIITMAFCLLLFSAFEFGHKLEYMKDFLLCVLILVLAKWWFHGSF